MAQQKNKDIENSVSTIEDDESEELYTASKWDLFQVCKAGSTLENQLI